MLFIKEKLTFSLSINTFFKSKEKLKSIISFNQRQYFNNAKRKILFFFRLKQVQPIYGLIKQFIFDLVPPLQYFKAYAEPQKISSDACYLPEKSINFFGAINKSALCYVMYLVFHQQKKISATAIFLKTITRSINSDAEFSIWLYHLTQLKRQWIWIDCPV